MSDNKRLATNEEVERCLYAHAERWNLCNPNQPIDVGEFRLRKEQAEKEGYKNEVCGECGGVFLAFHHFLTCRQDGCPMRDQSGKSVLDHMVESLEADANQ